jgi:hypothetical protein
MTKIASPEPSRATLAGTRLSRRTTARLRMVAAVGVLGAAIGAANAWLLSHLVPACQKHFSQELTPAPGGSAAPTPLTAITSR